MLRTLCQAAIAVLYATSPAAAEEPTTPAPTEPAPMEKEHSYFHYKPSVLPYINDSDYTVDIEHTPDWRLEEDPLTPIAAMGKRYEHHRPYRLSPAAKQHEQWANSGSSFTKNKDSPHTLGCYCATVYRRLTLLGTGAVITTRHILTTASSTEIVLRVYDKKSKLEGILGAWYDKDSNVFNSSMYMTPARIHYHPKFIMPENINVSHPLPIYQDLAIWAATYPFIGRFWYGPRAYICQRAGSNWMQRLSPVPGAAHALHEAIVVGYQFMMWYKKKPMPWFKYGMKTKSFMKNCPKAEWGWFFCLKGRFAMAGIDSGMMLHRNTKGFTWLYEGLWGVGAFSMTLRADMPVHYFTPIENYDALEWMYKAYMGRLPYRYLDKRFYDSQWKAPVPKPWFKIPWDYPTPDTYITQSPPYMD